MALDEQEPVERNVGISLFYLSGKETPGVGEFMLAPMVMRHDRISRVDRYSRAVVSLKVYDLQCRKSLQAAVTVVQENCQRLAFQIANKVLHVYRGVVLLEQREHAAAQFVIELVDVIVAGDEFAHTTIACRKMSDTRAMRSRRPPLPPARLYGVGRRIQNTP